MEQFPVDTRRSFVILHFRKCLASRIHYHFNEEVTKLGRGIQIHIRQKKLKLRQPTVCSQIKTGYSNEKCSEYIEKDVFFRDNIADLQEAKIIKNGTTRIKNKQGYIKLDILKKAAKELGYQIIEEEIWVEY